MASLKDNIQRAAPEDGAPQLLELLLAGGNGQEMVARELADFAGKAGRAIGKQNLRFTQATGIKQELARAGIAGVVLRIDAQLEVPQWCPRGFSAPASMDQLAFKGQQFLESLAGQRCILFFQASRKNKLVSNCNTQFAHICALFFVHFFSYESS